MFRVLYGDGGVRVGEIVTRSGVIRTPAFMPVATRGYVKALSPRDVVEVGTQAVISNAFHIFLRPGVEFVERVGGIHRFTGLEIPIFTDSGGFQVIRKDFSIRVVDGGLMVRDYRLDREVFYTPELCAEIQERMGVDVALALDFCVPYGVEGLEEESYRLTVEWGREFREFYEGFAVGIVQGGFSLEFRERCVKELVGIGFDGYAIGGLSIGEPRELMFRILGHVVKFIPEDRLRYLMGVGSPSDVVLAVEMGVDLFDSSYPTRNARHGTLLTWGGKINIKRSEYKNDLRSIDESCSCYVCQNFSRAYLHFLYVENEISAKRLLTLHNLYFMNDFFRRMRDAIVDGEFERFKERVLEIYSAKIL